MDSQQNDGQSATTLTEADKEKLFHEILEHYSREWIAKELAYYEQAGTIWHAMMEGKEGAKCRLHVVSLEQVLIGQGTTIDVSHKNGEFYYIDKETHNERKN